MNSIVKSSLVLAGVVALLTLAMMATGLHQRPAVGIPLFIFGAIILNVIVVFWGLRQTADKTYAQQLMNAAAIGALGGALIFCVSMVMTTVAFPDFLDESKAAQSAAIEAGMPAGEDRDVALERIAARTSVSEAFGGFVGTLGTSIMGGAVLAFFLRRK